MGRPTNATLAARAEADKSGVRECRICHEVLPLDRFGLYKGKRRTACKACTNAYTKAYREADDERRRKGVIKSRRWAEAHPEQYRAILRRSALKRLYGVTPEWWDATLAKQGGGCALCGATESGNGRKLHVDHDHDTGRVRGILCSKCNRKLGLFNDDPAELRKALRYLTR